MRDFIFSHIFFARLFPLPKFRIMLEYLVQPLFFFALNRKVFRSSRFAPFRFTYNKYERYCLQMPSARPYRFSINRSKSYFCEIKTVLTYLFYRAEI